MTVALSIRSRLILFVAVCMLPLYAILYYDGWFSSKQTVEEAQDYLQKEAKATAAGVDRTIRSAASLLYSFSKIPQLRSLDSTTPCKVLAGLLTLDSRYSSGYIIRPDGLIHCSSLPVYAPGNVSTKNYFRRAMASGKVEVGLPTLCRNTDTFCFPMALALRDTSGHVTSVLALDLDPIWLAKSAAATWSEPLTSMVWWDGEASIAFAWPKPKDWVGKFFADSKVGVNMLGQSAGSFIEKDVDDINKVFGYSTIRGIGNPDLKLILSVPHNVFLAPVQLRLVRNLMFFIVVILLALIATWVFGGFFINRFTELAQMVRHMGISDRRAQPEKIYAWQNRRRRHSEKSYSKDEFGMLAYSIDTMAEKHTAKIVKMREGESRLRTIIERLSEDVTLYKLDGRLLFFNPAEDKSATWLRTTLENLADGVSLYDLDGHLLYCNRAVVDMLGFSSADDCYRSQPEFAELFEFAPLDGTMWPQNEWPLARILRGENLNDLEVRVRDNRTGRQKIFNYSGTLIQDANECPLMAVVITLDITQRK